MPFLKIGAFPVGQASVGLWLFAPTFLLRLTTHDRQGQKRRQGGGFRTGSPIAERNMSWAFATREVKRKRKIKPVCPRLTVSQSWKLTTRAALVELRPQSSTLEKELQKVRLLLLYTFVFYSLRTQTHIDVIVTLNSSHWCNIGLVLSSVHYTEAENQDEGNFNVL